MTDWAASIVSGSLWWALQSKLLGRWNLRMTCGKGTTKRFEMACRGSALYLGFDQKQCAHPGSSRGRLNSNLPGSAWLLGVKPDAGFDSRQLRC